MAASLRQVAKVVIHRRFRRTQTSFPMTRLTLADIPTCWMTCRKWFRAACAILSRHFEELTCIVRGRGSTYQTFIRSVSWQAQYLGRAVLRAPHRIVMGCVIGVQTRKSCGWRGMF